MGTLSEVAEKVQFIQESLQMLDGHLGQLQDMSAKAVDTLNLLSATDNRQQEAVLLGHSQPLASPYQKLSHSWSIRSLGGSATPSHASLPPKPYRSTPPSLLRGLGPGKMRPSFEWPPGGSGGLCDSRPRWVLGNLEVDDRWRNGTGSGEASPGYRFPHGSLPHFWGVPWRDRTPCNSAGPSCPSSPTVLWAREAHRLPSQNESMEEEEEWEHEEDEEEEEEVGVDEDDDDYEARSVSRASSHVFLLSDPPKKKDRHLGIVNPAFSCDSELAQPKKSCFGKRWPFDAAERGLEHSRSLSASIETMAMPTAAGSEQGTTPPPSGQVEKGTAFYAYCVLLKIML